MTSGKSTMSSPLGVVGLVLLLLAGFALLPRVFVRRVDESSAAPAGDFTLPVIANETGVPGGADSKSVTLSALQGRPVILDFWASWCGPCQMESPIVNRIYMKYRDRGLVVIGVDTDDRPESGRAWALDHGISFPIASDDHSASGLFGVQGLPTLVVVSKTGKKLAEHSGMMDEQELDWLVKQAL